MKKDTDELNKERLGKIVQLAKHGVGGEKKVAISLVKKICAKHGLNFDDVMSERATVHEYVVKYRTEEELTIMVQIYCRYGQLDAKSDSPSYNQWRKVMVFKTTPEKYIEVLNAIDVLIPLWRKEKKVMQEAIRFGFYDRHHLYYSPTPEERKSYFKKHKEKESEDDKRAREAGSSLAHYMKNADIVKQLTAGK